MSRRTSKWPALKFPILFRSQWGIGSAGAYAAYSSKAFKAGCVRLKCRLCAHEQCPVKMNDAPIMCPIKSDRSDGWEPQLEAASAHSALNHLITTAVCKLSGTLLRRATAAGLRSAFVGAAEPLHLDISLPETASAQGGGARVRATGGCPPWRTRRRMMGTSRFRCGRSSGCVPCA